MYRKRLEELQKMEDDRQVLTRVANYPMVKDTWSKVSEVYQRGKDGSRILRFCGDVAETSASLAYKASLPVIEKLPVGTVNDYAVQKLEVLEEKYPTLVTPTEQLVDDLKTYSSTKLDGVKSYGVDQFNRLAELTRLTAVLDMADIVVDKLLPDPTTANALEGEEAPQQEGEETTPLAQELEEVQQPEKATGKMMMLSDKLKRRAYQSAMAKAGAIQKRSQEAVARLYHTVDLIDYAQKNIRSVTLEDAEEKVKSIYEEITRESPGDEQEEPLPANANLEKKAIYVARAMTLRAKSTFFTISRLSYALPSYAQAAVNEAYSFSHALYQTFSKASSFEEFRGSMLAELRHRLSVLEAVAAGLSRYISESAPLRWLAARVEAKMAITNEATGATAQLSDLSDSEENPGSEDTEEGGLDDTLDTTPQNSSSYMDDTE